MIYFANYFVILQAKSEIGMKKMKSLLLRIWHVPGLKYVLVTVLAVVLIGFVDENSVWHHMRNTQRISELEGEIEKYDNLNKKNQARIRELDGNPKAIEKIARERYFMKADDEDIFVLSDDLEEEQNATAE
jgi:cell division protein FtsB